MACQKYFPSRSLALSLKTRRMVEIDNWLSATHVRSISDLVHSEEVYLTTFN